MSCRDFTCGDSYNDSFLSNKELSSFIREKLKTSVQLLEENDFSPEIHTEEVLKQFSTNSLESIGVKPDTVAAFAVCGLFAYIHDTQKALVGRFSEIIKHDADPIMTIGFTARRNLELTETLRNKEKKARSCGCLTIPNFNGQAYAKILPGTAPCQSCKDNRQT